MEIDTKKDGRVEFDEFMHWFTKKAIGMDAGSVGWRLIEARERALRDHALERRPLRALPRLIVVGPRAAVPSPLGSAAALGVVEKVAVEKVRVEART